MVDEVEISNVGGPKGVASEATLAALVSALSKGDTARDRGLRLEGLARASNTREIKTSTKEQGILGKAIVGTAGAAVGLGKEFLFGGNRLSDFSRAVFGADTAITSLVKYTDNLIDTYRELSSVGAGFNNSLFDFIKTSAMTGMSLGDFSDLVSQNSTRLRMLGGTVSDGAKRFGQISKTLRQDFGVGLSRIGFTMSDMNDVLLEYTEFSIRRQGRELRSDEEVAASAAQFGIELDQLSRLTGISRKQLAQSVAQQTQDQRIRSAMAEMDPDQAKHFGQALATAGQYSEGFKEAILGMVKGTPTNDFAKGLYQSSETFAAMAQNVKNMDPGQQIDFMRKVAQESADYYKQYGGIYQNITNDIFRAGGDVSAALGGLASMTDADRERALEEQQAWNRITATLVAFENALNNVKTFLMDELFGENAPFGRSLKAFGESITTLVNSLFGESGTGGTAGELTSGFQGIIDSLFGENGILTLLVKDFTTFTNELALSDDPMGLFKTRVGELGTNIKNWFIDMLLGTKVETATQGRPGEVRIERQGGLLQSISDGFSSLFEEGSILTTIKESISSVFGKVVEGISDFWNNPDNKSKIDKFYTDMTSMFKKLLDSMQDALADWIPGIDKSESYYQGIQDSVNAGTATSEQIAELADKIQRTQAEKTSENTNDAIIQALGPVLGTLYDYTPLTETSSYYGARLGQSFDNWWNETTPEDVVNSNNPYNPTNPTDRRSIGTLGATGLKFEPKDTVAQLHRGERVLSPEETAKYNSTGNQTMSNEKLDQLNNTMMRVAGLLDSALGVQTRTMKNVKSLGFDYYRGSPA